MKRFWSIFVIAIVCMCLALGTIGCGNTPNEPVPVAFNDAATAAETYAGEVHDVPTISDYTVPEAFDLSTIRFAFWSPSTGWTEDVDNAPFDESRPTIIHSHGQGGDAHMFTPRAMYDAGYNVISFLWGCLSDDELEPIEQKIWNRIEKYIDYSNGQSEIIYTDGFDCTITELYVARYCDFFALHPNYNQPIRLTGHSYGGQLNFALSAYITTLFQAGRLPGRLLPERYTLLDPYFDTLQLDFDCRWLGQTFRYSSVQAAIYCMQNILIPNNIAIEMLRTSPLVEVINGIVADDAPDYFTELKPLFRLTELKNTNELRLQFDNMAEGMGFWHTIANDFYFSPQADNIYYDEDGEMIFGRETPAAFVLATRQMHFDFWVDNDDYNQYQNVRVERTITEDNEDLTIIAGLVMQDADGDGTPNDKACYRLSNVCVKLIDNATGEIKAVQTNNGFYRFEAERGHTYTVETHAGNYVDATQTVEAQNDFCFVRNFALTRK